MFVAGGNLQRRWPDKEAVLSTVTEVRPDYLSRVVDGSGSAANPCGIDGRVDAAAV